MLSMPLLVIKISSSDINLFLRLFLIFAINLSTFKLSFNEI